MKIIIIDNERIDKAMSKWVCLMECLVRVYMMIHGITDDKSTSKTLLKKIEQSLKNSEANLKEQEQTKTI